jgi:hypothetical protein
MWKARGENQLRPSPLAPWELRIGDFRVFYEVSTEGFVRVLAISQGPQRVVRARQKGRDMKRIDLTKGHHSLNEVLTCAKSETVLIPSASGEDFVLEPADEFDREVATLGAGEKFTPFLDARSKETGDIPLRQVRQKRGGA